MDFQEVLERVLRDVQPHIGEGKVADYIPALGRVDPSQFGMALHTADGHTAQVGAAHTAFSIQSISKVFSLTLALQLVGEWLWQRIGREPSGDPFNSLMQLEHEQGVPRNPLINAGAIAVADRLVSAAGDPKAELLAFMGELAGEAVAFDAEVAASEAATGFRNVAMAAFMKSFGKLDNAVPAVLDLYFHQCALRMSCVQLARAARFLCSDGRRPDGEGTVISQRQTRRVNALMLTCGTYDAAGEFAFRIGIPCKSGVGGGILAVLPGRLSMCVWSPGLGPSGNSALGMRALESFVEHSGLSLF